MCPTLANILEPLSSAIKKGDELLARRLYRLRHKMEGVNYHLDNFVTNENAEIAKFEKENHIPGGVDMLIQEPKILYEMEAFLFQVKSTLDMLAQLTAILFNLKDIRTYSDDGEKLINTLRQNSPDKVKPIAQEVIELISKYKHWARHIIDMRDEVTHISELDGFSGFIIHAYKGGGLVEISFPAMPDGKRARNYLEKASATLLDLITEMMPILAKVLAQRNISTPQGFELPEKLGEVLD
jgi:hypothetical protein